MTKYLSWKLFEPLVYTQYMVYTLFIGYISFITLFIGYIPCMTLLIGYIPCITLFIGYVPCITLFIGYLPCITLYMVYVHYKWGIFITHSWVLDFRLFYRWLSIVNDIWQNKYCFFRGVAPVGIEGLVPTNHF